MKGAYGWLVQGTVEKNGRFFTLFFQNHGDVKSDPYSENLPASLIFLLVRLRLLYA
jgi:hypothetical protein